MSARLEVHEVLPLVEELLKAEPASEYDWQWTLDVAKRVIQLLAEPDYAPVEVGGVGLSDSGVVPFEGGLIREDAVYEAFPGDEVKVAEVLEWLRYVGILTNRLLRPDPALDEAVIRLWDVSPKKNKHASLAPLTACAVLTGRDHRSAALLHQIRYWGGKMKVRLNSKLWIVKPSAEWQAETDLTKNQYERALKCLKDREFVVTEQHMSGIYGGKAVTHLRPIYYFGLRDRPPPCQQGEAA